MGLARACGRATCQWGAEEKACWCLEDRGECDRFLQGSLSGGPREYFHMAQVFSVSVVWRGGGGGGYNNPWRQAL